MAKFFFFFFLSKKGSISLIIKGVQKDHHWLVYTVSIPAREPVILKRTDLIYKIFKLTNSIQNILHDKVTIMWFPVKCVELLIPYVPQEIDSFSED